MPEASAFQVDRPGSLSRGRMPSQESLVALPSDFAIKEQVRSAVDIVDVIGQTVQLRPQGRNFVGLCPFHADTRPSFQVNPVRQTWKCWPCDRGGDVFAFVQARDGIGFGEALRLLADKAGIELPRFSGKRVPPGSPQDKTALLNAWKFAIDQFYGALDRGISSEAQWAKEYLSQRGMNDQSRQLFRIGYAPDDWQWLLVRAKQAGISAEIMEAAGLALRKKESGRGAYDRFRGRLIFPIFDLQDRPISAGGRIVPAADPSAVASGLGAKYINGPETLLFSKSNQLYGLNLARAAVQQSGEVLVMEGYTDVIAARQAGIEPVVAVLGTALGEGHIRIIKRFADRVILVLDGDNAGRRRADQVLELFIRADVDLRILTLPDNQDPADFIQAEGKMRFMELVAAAPDAIEHKLATVTAGVDLLSDTHRSAAALESMLAVIAQAPQPLGDLRIDQILLRLTRVFGTEKNSLTQRVKQLRIAQSKRPSSSRVKRPVAPSPLSRVAFHAADRANAALLESGFEATDPLEVVGSSGTVTQPVGPIALAGMDREFIELLIEDPKLASVAVESIDPSWLETETARVIFSFFQELDLAGQTLDVQSVLLACEDDALRSLIVTMDERVQQRSGQLTASPDQRYRGVLKQMEQRRWMIQRRQHISAMQTADHEDEAQVAELLQQIVEGERQRRDEVQRRPEKTIE